jgi:SAM-dependent methyltransferase
MLTPQQRARFAPFLESYPIQRSLEGWERNSAYHLSLPWVPRDDPTSRIWRIRRRSLSTLENQVSVHFGDTSRAWALDLGAGNCWLSRRLAGMGFSTVALDLNVEGTDSLSTGQLFIEHDKVWFDRVQGTMDRLPFGDCTFDLCTVSAALYYSDVPATLREVYRVLRPNGMFLISDSPVYSASAPGEIMAKEQRQRLSRVLGHEPAELPGGAGFLVRSEILEGLRATGFRTSILSSQHPLGRARRRIRALLPKQGREEAKFPVLVSIKPSS